MPKSMKLTTFSTRLKKKEQTKAERAHRIEKDLPTVLKQCEVDLREEYDQSYYKDWGLQLNDLKFCGVNVGTNFDGKVSVRFFKENFVGGFRTPQIHDNVELERHGKETMKALDEYIKMFKKCFKDKTGKTLKLSKQNKDVNWTLIALNGLYKVRAESSAQINTDLGQEEYPANSKERKDFDMD